MSAGANGAGFAAGRLSSTTSPPSGAERRSSVGVNSAGDGGGTLESDDAERPAASHCVPPAADRALSADQRGGGLMVEGKGFDALPSRFCENLRAEVGQNSAGRCRAGPQWSPSSRALARRPSA